MSKLSIAFMAASIALAPTWKASFASGVEREILGEVGGRQIAVNDYNVFIRFKRPQMKEIGVIPAHGDLIEEFATDLVLAASAQSNDEVFADRRDLKWKLWELETKEAFSRILEEEMLVGGPLPEEKLREYYNEHADEYRRKASFSFRNIFLDATRAPNPEARVDLRRKARVAREEIERFAGPDGVVPLDDFIRVAAETMGVVAKDIKSRGGFSLGQIKPELEEAALSLQVGQIGDVIETENGFYILRLESYVKEGLRPFEEVAPQIEEHLTFLIQQERFIDLRKPLQDPGRFEIHEEGLANLVRWASDPNEAENVLLAETKDFKLSLLDYIEYLKYSRAAPLPGPSRSPQEIRGSHSLTLYNNLLYAAVALEEAVARGYTEDATYEERIRVGRTAILGEEHFTQLLKRRLEAMTPVSEKKIQAYYEEHSEDFMTDPIGRYREIAVQPKKATHAYEEEFAFRAAEAEALEALELIRSGSSEEGVIKKYSDGEEAEEGGLTPPLTPGRRFSSRVWDELKTLEVGEWTKEPYRERGKAMLLKLEELAPSEQKTLDSVRGDIALKLVQQKALDTAQALRKEILEENGFRFNQEALNAQPPIPDL
jgi:parvulin-like peptidyl-prolyl isomerase